MAHKHGLTFKLHLRQKVAGTDFHPRQKKSRGEFPVRACIFYGSAHVKWKYCTVLRHYSWAVKMEFMSDSPNVLFYKIIKRTLLVFKRKKKGYVLNCN